MAIRDLLEQNRKWAEERIAGDPDYFRRHVGGQKPRLLFIGCSDSRVPAEQILDCGPGELFVHRNVANVVAFNDGNIAAVIQYALEHLHIEDIVVCGHHGCGGVAAACSGGVTDEYIADWLMIATRSKQGVERRVAAEGLTPSKEEFLQMVVAENVRRQVKHLSQLTMVRKAWGKHPGTPRLHGWVYDIATGRVNEVIETMTRAETEGA